MTFSFKTDRLWQPGSRRKRNHSDGYLVHCCLPLLLAILFVSTTAAHATLESKLLAGDGDANNRFGNSVAIDIDTAVVSAFKDDSNTGSAYVYERNATGNWIEKTPKLTASDRAVDDYFGISVAAHGNTIVVGAYGDDDNGGASGSAYVFMRDALGNWIEKTPKLTASDAAAGDLFGISVAIYGNTIAVGANGDDDKGSGSGSVYIFDYDAPTDTWNQTVKLTASDGFDNDQFGTRVSIHSDTVVAGAHQDDDNGDGSGSAYVFKRSAGVWSQEDKLTASDGAAEDWFGYSVSIHDDTALVGAQQDDISTGSAYVFKRNAGIWSQQVKLTASDAASSDLFGNSVSISGNTALIGAFIDDTVSNANTPDMGSAYIYTRNAAGTWSEVKKLTASDSLSGDQFGFSVSISGDTALVGAHQGDDQINNIQDTGSAYAFQDALWLDTDGDDVPDVLDAFPLDPNESTDTDGDGIGDNSDNCPASPNPNQLNTDNDLHGDACDPDDDGDGVPDVLDAFPLDPNESTDTDGDGIGDNSDNCPASPNSNQLNTDNDLHGDACDPDDDNDGMPDNYENANGFSPLNASDAKTDTDNDGYSNLSEYRAGSDPLDPGSVPKIIPMPWLPLLLD